MQFHEPQISDRLGISPELIHLTLSLTKESLVSERTYSLCSLIWPDCDSFESANWPLESSTNFRIWWKICFCLWSAQVAYSKASHECRFRCKFELASHKRPVWHTRVLPRIVAQQYGDKNESKWWNKFYWLFTIYRGKPVDLRFMQMVRKALPNGKFRSR